MAYSDDIDALLPDHYWTFDNTWVDTGAVGGANANTTTSGTLNLIATPIAEDSTHSFQLGTNLSWTKPPDNPEMNSAPNPARTMGGWVRFNQIHRPPVCIYKEGAQTNNMAFFMGFGNSLSAQAIEGGQMDLQSYSDAPVQIGRSYHILFRFGGTNNSNTFTFWVDGVQQARTSPDPAQPNKINMGSHSADIMWGDPDLVLNTGGQPIDFTGAEGCLYSHWASWTEELTDNEIRVELFEKGALPTHSVNSQTQVDALPASINSQTCALRVTNTGNATLSSGVVFSDNSIDLQYTGTGTLTWIVDVGGTLNPIISTPNGGTVNVVPRVLVSFVGPVASSRLYVEATGTVGDVTTGDVLHNAPVNTDPYSFTHNYEGDLPVLWRLRNHSTDPRYKPLEGIGTIATSGLTVNVSQQPDE